MDLDRAMELRINAQKCAINSSSTAVGWDEDIVDAVDAMFMAYERSHGLL